MEPSITSVGVLALLGLGLVFGLKHATEVDHVVAVSAIVSEHRRVFRSALVGGLWGAGHTASLVIVGIVVLVFQVAIPAAVARWLSEIGLKPLLVGAMHGMAGSAALTLLVLTQIRSVSLGLGINILDSPEPGLVSPEGSKIVAGGRRTPERNAIDSQHPERVPDVTVPQRKNWHPFRVRARSTRSRRSALCFDLRLLSDQPSGLKSSASSPL